MTIRELLRVIWAGKYYVAMSVLIVSGGALFYLRGETPQYQSTATVQLVQSEVLPGSTATSSVMVDTDPSIVTSKPVADQAAKSLGYAGQPSALSSTVTATYNAVNQTMDISAESSDPSSAVSVANAFANAYVAYLPTVLKGQIAELDAQRQTQQAKLDQTSAQLAKNPKDPLALAEQTSIIATYQAILTQQDAYESISPPGKILDPATEAIALGFSNSTVLAVAVLAGLIAGVGLALARRALDPRVRSTNEAGDAAGVQVLAELYGVGAAQKEARRSGLLPISSRMASPFTESIRELRTALQVSLPQARRKVIVVTAVDPDAPRSFIAANLAASWALSGIKTVVFSGDMRRPQLDEFLPPPPEWAGDPHGVRPTDIPNLTLFPVPDEHMDPADYLATAGAAELVRRLADDADVLLIDAPPVLAAADATIIGGYADSVVLIASLRHTDRVVLKEASERLKANNVPISGLAVAGVKGDRRMLYASTYGDVSLGSRLTGSAKDAIGGSDLHTPTPATDDSNEYASTKESSPSIMAQQSDDRGDVHSEGSGAAPYSTNPETSSRVIPRRRRMGIRQPMATMSPADGEEPVQGSPEESFDGEGRAIVSDRVALSKRHRAGQG